MYLIPIISAILANIFAWTAIVTAVVNTLWLLVKDVTLFSWWWVLGAVVAFVISIVVMFVGIILNR